ncbi:hypothetical protein [Calothrix sp. PCC 6303]|uniref:hypothetical protein n=1 Tax=Calothrix sp. PCC 6303 TaxID=1170562 RepID=UPI0002A026CD|nr:hypothetical protein [Calothrix sp. PCC 6303]AFY99495.1 hypothetical protein Cal6303_0418 [Calothrix sp. PCC 6303]
MKILYKQILNLELWHDYYLGQQDPHTFALADYDISETLALVPTTNCQQVLKNLRWIFRLQPHGASIFASVEEVTPDDSKTNFPTQIPVKRPERLTFWLVVRDRYFANFTNLPLTAPRHQIYYFSNRSGNQGHALFLTQPLPVYTSNTTYHLGQLVTHENHTLEVLRDRTNVTTIPDANDWDILPSSQYVSELDRLPQQEASKMYNIPEANPGDRFRFTLIDANEQETFALEVVAPNKHIPGDAIAVSINFPNQIPGCYQLRLNNIQVDKFILCEQAIAHNAFALVEIVLNQNLVSPAFSLLKFEAGKTFIQPKTYVIRFKNRATHWRYRYEKPHGFTKDKLPDFELKDDKTYFSKRPQGLLRQPKRLFTDGRDQRLPAPGVMLIKPERQIDQETEKEAIAIFSDIHL